MFGYIEVAITSNKERAYDRAWFAFTSTDL